MLQDIQMYMKQAGISTLNKTVVRLGDSHEVRIVVGQEQIRAQVREIGEITSPVTSGGHHHASATAE